MCEIARERRSRGWRMAGAAALVSAAVAGAQPVEQPAGGQPAGGEALSLEPPSAAKAPSPFGLGATDYSLRGYTSYELSAGIRGDKGEVSVLRVGVDFDATMPVNKTTRLRLSAGSEYVNFDFRGQTDLSLDGRTPFEELSNHHFGLGIEQGFADSKWSWLARGMVRDGVEGGAKMIDGVAGDLTAGVLYELSPGAKIGIGATVFWRVQDFTRYLPIPFVDLDLALNDHWRIVLTVPQWGGFVYKPSRDFTLKMGVGVRYQDYRLSSNNQVPEGVFREFSLPAMVEADWRFAEAWTLQAGAGSNLYQRLDINNKNGDDVVRAETQWAPLFMLGVRWDF